jgi:S-(hydroxymethyl)glutathione dehydrogenase/alcohol dehydrogenase
VSVPASAFCISGKTFHAGQQGGLNMMRDLPRFVRLAEEGLFDGAALVGRTYALDQARDAFEAVAARRVVSAVVVF